MNFLKPAPLAYNEHMKIETVVVGQLDTNCVVIADTITRDACIIDPGDEPERISAYIDANELRPAYIIFTHAHYDHVCAARELKEKYHAGIVMHADDVMTYDATKRLCMSWGYDEEDFPLPDLFLQEGDTLRVGDLCFSVIHTPGHTPGSICLFGHGLLVTGDTLFRGSAGRTDLPGGNREHLLHSLKKLVQLPYLTRVVCGHDEETTIGVEATTNPFMLFT
jgi:glyoxylase-like metal-dependent hydrolase (beta-lactamase superfamily II)